MTHFSRRVARAALIAAAGAAVPLIGAASAQATSLPLGNNLTGLTQPDQAPQIAAPTGAGKAADVAKAPTGKGKVTDAAQAPTGKGKAMDAAQAPTGKGKVTDVAQAPAARTQVDQAQDPASAAMAPAQKLGAVGPAANQAVGETAGATAPKVADVANQAGSLTSNPPSLGGLPL